MTTITTTQIQVATPAKHQNSVKRTDKITKINLRLGKTLHRQFLTLTTIRINHKHLNSAKITDKTTKISSVNKAPQDLSTIIPANIILELIIIDH